MWRNILTLAFVGVNAQNDFYNLDDYDTTAGGPTASGDESCQKYVQASCQDFTFLAASGDCSIYASYDPCQGETHEDANFQCWVSGYDPDYDTQY